MPRFTIPVNEKKRRQKRISALIYGVIVLAVFSISVLSGNSKGFSRIAITIVLVNSIWFLWSTISSIRDLDRVRFVEIDEDRIEWAVQEKFDTCIVIAWNDIRWIKKENDNSISIYLDSSFDNNLPLTDFANNDKTEILRLVQELAIQKQIRLVNFSERPLALA